MKSNRLMRAGVGSFVSLTMLLVGPGAGESIASSRLIPKPFAGKYGPAIENYSSYDGQTKCSRGSKVGVVAFERHVLRKFATKSYGIKYSCGGSSVSEHKEGRAIDWHLNAYNWRDRRVAKKLFRWLFKTDWWGNTHSKARRLGVMYIIWNKKMWRSYRPYDGWQKYEGSSPHTDHIHISFARKGGLGRTSYWTGQVADIPPAWLPPVPTPTPTPSTTT